MASQAASVETAEIPPVREPLPAADTPVRRSWWRRVHWGLLIVGVLAGWLRYRWLDYAQPVPVSDFKHYLDAALTMLDFGFFGVGHPSAWRLPAFPAFLAVGALINRDAFFLSGLTAALSVLQVVLTYWLAYLVFRRRVAAFVAGLVAAIVPTFITFAPVLASEHLLAVFVLGALIAAMRTQRWVWWMALLAGLLLGGATLTRGEALAYLPAVLLVAAVGAWKARRRVLVMAGATLLVLIGTALVVAPWVVRNEVVVGSGAGLSTTGGFNFYLAHSPGAYGWRTPLPLPLLIKDEVSRNEFGWTYGLQYARNHPEHWGPTIETGTRELLAPASYAPFFATVSYDAVERKFVPRGDPVVRAQVIRLTEQTSHWLLWTGLAGFLLMPAWRARAWLAFLGIVLANWLVYAVAFWAQARYRFVIDALACVAVGGIPASIAAVVSWVRGGWSEPSRWPQPSEHVAETMSKAT
jgi:4-amino-4-deoxy-L-arabinose transferase-like glycosyltransferase